MKQLLKILIAFFLGIMLVSCEANDETYNQFIGDWHLVRINNNGEYRAPRPNKEDYYNLHFMQNNSLVGQSYRSNFASIYNIRKNNRIVLSGFNYVPIEEDSTDNLVFMNNLIKADRYEMVGDTLKFKFDKKTYLVFARRFLK
ncbi:MAG: hypothetical protein HUK15_01785 [Bacteroidales bacterium]|nr:hypothetical protein [Bacteroidales bacterium]